MSNALLPVVLLLVIGRATCAEEHVADFRSGKGPDSAWRLLGLDAERVMRPERGGLRIKLEGTRKERDPVGLAPQFAISGDFEVTLLYEIVSASNAPASFGLGVSVHLQFNKKPMKTASVSHYQRQGPGNLLCWDYKIGGGPLESDFVHIERNKGCIGLRRTESSLAFLAGASESALEELGRIDIGREDLQTVRITAHSGGGAAALDVRFLAIKVRAGALRTSPEPPRSAGGWLFWTALAAAVIVCGGAIWRRRRRA